MMLCSLISHNIKTGEVYYSGVCQGRIHQEANLISNIRKSSVSRNIAVFILVIEQCLISVSTGGSNVVADL